MACKWIFWPGISHVIAWAKLCIPPPDVAGSGPAMIWKKKPGIPAAAGVNGIRQGQPAAGFASAGTSPGVLKPSSTAKEGVALSTKGVDDW
ncbi:hypothetical protein Dimus_006499 [Dionaea muscipula]